MFKEYRSRSEDEMKGERRKKREEERKQRNLAETRIQ